ncbi:hypothetical protein [Nocardia sp. NPDC020380]|uniref:hypothetical protein n=1 Tax=Nocardia sp. NPDC020380 TaxID=3364309 RepID=UPI0037BB3B2C
MEFRSTTAAASLVIGALVVQGAASTVLAGSASADPAPAPHIAYSAKLVDKTVVTTLKGGTFALSQALDSDLAAGGTQRLAQRDGVAVAADGTPVDPAKVVNVVDVKDDDGHVLLTLPLEVHLGPIDIPVKPAVEQNGTVLRLTPDKPAGLTFTQPVTVQPIASQLENQRAQNDFTTQFSLATAVGTFIGTALGATIGCVATIAAGCVAGLVTGAGVGGIIGTVALGGPTLIASGFDLLNTLNAPAGTTKWADKTSTVPTPPPAVPPTQAAQANPAN